MSSPPSHQLHLDLPAGSAHLERVPTGWSLRLEADPDEASAVDLLQSAVDAVAAAGGGLVRHWVQADDPAFTAASLHLGMVEERELRQLRCPLPLDEDWELAIRPFVVGRDEEAWLAVNNRAFSRHPEQGGWSIDDLRARMAEPWFDAAGFLLHEAQGRLLGFCWTKVHDDVEPKLGEIYVIAVDPDAGGRGLGRALTLAGLDHLHRRGLRYGMLYVEATNDPALRLYDSLGFSVHHSDRSYAREVAASDRPPG